MVNSSSKKINIHQNILTLSYNLVKISRPTHWIKNFALFAALVFSGNLFSQPHFMKVLLAFFSFSFTTSATYIFNDILDVASDKLHPIKKNRPLAAGKISLTAAFILMGAYILASFYIAINLNTLFVLSLATYISIQSIYSLGLKNIPIIDILIIASGFILRVYAGAFVINSHLSVWFLLCVISVALFLASGKRRAELGAIPKGETRKSLVKYSGELLNSYVTMFGNATWMSWALFTFFESPTPILPVWLFLAEISRTTTISKLLMVTIPVTIFGIMRYESLIFENRSEAPEKLLLTDISLVSSIIFWVALVILILYGGVSS